jgi:hypothetical protein
MVNEIWIDKLMQGFLGHRKTDCSGLNKIPTDGINLIIAAKLRPVCNLKDTN